MLYYQGIRYNKRESSTCYTVRSFAIIRIVAFLFTRYYTVRSFAIIRVVAFLFTRCYTVPSFAIIRIVAFLFTCNNSKIIWEIFSKLDVQIKLHHGEVVLNIQLNMKSKMAVLSDFNGDSMLLLFYVIFRAITLKASKISSQNFYRGR